MAKREGGKQNKTTASANPAAESQTTTDAMEQRVIAFAEQLGRISGTVAAKAEGWMDREALNKQIAGVRDSAAELEAQGVPAEFAVRSATLLYKYPLLDIAEAASTADIAPSLLATTYFDLFEQIEGSSLLSRIDSLARNDPWETMARAALREDFYDVLSSASVALATPKAGSSRQVSSAVIESRLGLIADALSELSARETSNNRDFEILTIVLRALRSLRTAAFTPR